MGGCRCIFRECTVSTARHPRMHFFRFPTKDPERFAKWIKMANVPHLKDLSPSQQKNKVVCARHFRIECFMNYLKDKLVPKAVPTLERLKDNFAIDYDTEDKPQIIVLPQPSSPYMIPPPDFECPLYLDDIDLELVEESYAEEDNNCIVTIRRSSVQKTEQAIVKQKPRAQKRPCSPPNVTDTNTSKIKILNVEAPENEANDSANASKTDGFVSQFVDFLDSSEEQEENYLLSINDACDEEDEDNDNVLKIEYIAEDMDEREETIKTYKDASTQVDATSKDEGPSNRKHSKICQEYESQLKNERSKYMSLQEDTSKQIMQLVEALQTAKREIEQRKLQLEELNKNSPNSTQQKFEELQKQHEDIEAEADQLRISNKMLKTRLETLSNQHKSVVKLKEELEAKNYSLQQKQQQVSTVSTSAEAPVPAASNPIAATPSLSKAQLFYGIRRYLNGAMISLVRMEMFGNAEREWKPDEKQVAMDLLALGESAYLYFTDEWRFRLPTVRQVREWVNQVAEAPYEEDL